MDKKWSQLVRNGTPNHGVNLCDSCQHLQVIKGHSESEEIRKCGAWNGIGRIRFKVSQCTNYQIPEDFPLHTMETQAYLLVIKKDGTKGWLTPKEAQAYRMQEDEDEDDDE